MNQTWWDITKKIAEGLDVISLMFLALIIFLLWVLSKWQRDKVGEYKNFDITDVIMKDGHVSRDALFEWIGVLTLTFIVVHQEFKDVVSDTILAIYVGAVLAKGITHIIKGTPTSPRDIDKPEVPDAKP